jgi:hypothetical protein
MKTNNNLPYIPTSQLTELLEEAMFSGRFWGFIISIVIFSTIMSLMLANLFSPTMPVDDIEKFSYFAHPATLFITIIIMVIVVFAYITLSPIASDKKETIEELAKYAENMVATANQVQATCDEQEATIKQYETYIKQAKDVMEQQLATNKEDKATIKQLRKQVEQLLSKAKDDNSKFEATLKENKELWDIKEQFELVKQFLPFVTDDESSNQIAPVKIDAAWLQESNSYIGKCNLSKLKIKVKL